MYLDQAKRRVGERSYPDASEIVPCSPAEVEALERRIGSPLPGAVREFLLWCGHGLGEIWRGNRCLEYDELVQGAFLNEAREILREAGQETSPLDGPVLVIQFDECDQFAFVRFDEGENPPVYGRCEGEEVRLFAESFSAYVELLIEQEFGGGEGGAGGSGTVGAGDPSGGGSAGIVPPELTPDASWLEADPALLPPSIRERLGTIRASFLPSGANRFAGGVFGVLFMVGGLALMGLGIRELVVEQFHLPVWSGAGMSWGMIGVIELAAAGIVGGGAVMIRQMVRLGRCRVFLGEAGVCRSHDRGVEVLLWNEIGQVEEVILRDQAPVNTPLARHIPFGCSRRLVLRARDGRELSFDDTGIRSFARFEAMLRRAAGVHGLGWSQTRV